MVNGGKRLQSSSTFWVVVLLLAFCSEGALGGEQASNAIVKDRQGKTYRVVDLRAKYSAGGMWTGSRPQRTVPSLHIVLSTEEDRVTTEEEIEFVFTEVHRIVLNATDFPSEVVSASMPSDKLDPVRIELRDGRVAILGRKDRPSGVPLRPESNSWLFIEIDANGQQTKKTKFNAWWFKAGEQLGAGLYLDGFAGRAKTRDGKEGDFWIATREVASIEFEQRIQKTLPPK